MGIDFSVLSRRKLLSASLAGGVALGGGAGLLLGLRGAAPDVSALRILTAQEHRTLAQLARALFPAAGGAFSAKDVDLARLFDGFLADEPPWNQADLKKAIFLLEFGPVLFERRLRTFSHLGEEERLAHFAAWGESSVLVRRQVAVAFRKFMSLVFYDQPGAWPAIGYDGPLIRPGDPK